MKYSISKKLVVLSPKEFETWFKARKFEGDWQTEFKNIGGKLSEPKRTRKKSGED